MTRLWKFTRIILFALLTWFVLAVLWAVLPSPSWESDGGSGSDYATAVLRSGKTLTRVYDRDHFSIDSHDRSSFVIDYRFDPQTFDLFVSGDRLFSSILNDERFVVSESAATVNVSVRTGDTDGANLPWFEHADAVLLFWWIHRDTAQVRLEFSRTEDAKHGNYELHLRTANYPQTTLFSLSMKRNDTSTITAIVPPRPLSSSPSMTYPIRIVLLVLVAPVAVLMNEVLGTLSDVIGPVIIAVFTIALYGFLILAVIVSFWRCVGGYSLDETVEKVRDRLDGLREHRMLGWLPVDKIKDGLDGLYRNRVMVRFIGVCRDGWHPEREALRAVEAEEAEKEDVEKGDAGKCDS